jgi:hypothetical protein
MNERPITLDMSHDHKHWILRTAAPGTDPVTVELRCTHNALGTETRMYVLEHGDAFEILSREDYKQRIRDVMAHEPGPDPETGITEEKARDLIFKQGIRCDGFSRGVWGVGAMTKERLVNRWLAIRELVPLAYTW